MFNLKKKSALKFSPPVQGKVIPLNQVKDEVFSQKMMGDGFAIIPDNGRVSAPLDAEVMMVFPTGHAIGLKSKDGIELLIHVGIDTVNLQGDGFTIHCKPGQHVHQGDLLIEFNLQILQEHQLDPSCITIFTSGQSVTELKEGMPCVNSEFISFE